MLVLIDGQFYNGPDTEFESLADAKADRVAMVDAAAGAIRGRIVGSTSAAEMASWALKLSEARAYQADSGASTPMLAAEAGYRGVSVSDLVTRVLTNATAFGGAEAMIAGVAGMHRDAISALTTIEAVVGYDIRAGWPEV